MALPKLIALDAARIPDSLQFWPNTVPNGIMEKAKWLVEQDKRKYLFVEQEDEVNILLI